MSSQVTSSGARRVFPRTQWSVVLAARQRTSPESAAALETICRAYWYPLYAYVRRCGHSAHDAQDLTQEFFSRLLEKRWLDSADRDKGRLRTFLIVALKRFMAKEWRRASAQRRGGGQVHLTIDTSFAESRYAAAVPGELQADGVFDRQWALTVMDLTLKRLQQELQSAGKGDDFEALKSCLMAPRGTIDYSAMAAGLRVSEGAARIVVHRFRKRFRELFREEIAQTLADRGELEGEMHHLAETLARP